MWSLPLRGGLAEQMFTGTLGPCRREGAGRAGDSRSAATGNCVNVRADRALSLTSLLYNIRKSPSYPRLAPTCGAAVTATTRKRPLVRNRAGPGAPTPCLPSARHCHSHFCLHGLDHPGKRVCDILPRVSGVSVAFSDWLILLVSRPQGSSACHRLAFLVQPEQYSAVQATLCSSTCSGGPWVASTRGSGQ